jgi:hypothetical protein
VGLFSRNPDKHVATAENSAGSPAYDATYHPADAAELAVAGGRLQMQRDLHLFYGKSAAADAFSHYRESIPSPTTTAMMGLARQRDLIEWQTSRKTAQPYPGVTLGHVPSFAASPGTNPIIQPFGHFTHHAHQVEPHRISRARFGR